MNDADILKQVFLLVVIRRTFFAASAAESAGALCLEASFLRRDRALLLSDLASLTLSDAFCSYTYTIVNFLHSKE